MGEGLGGWVCHLIPEAKYNIAAGPVIDTNVASVIVVLMYVCCFIFLTGEETVTRERDH